MASGDVEESARSTDGGSGRRRARRKAFRSTGQRVNVRSGPGTSCRLVRTLRTGATVRINCQMPGETITGPYGTTNLWDNIANGQYVSDAYVNTGSDGYVAPRRS
ncbi:SH3 domain-containing protein [Streptomyces sp. A3M-1-3]|uniref:SH3 domain-containing protein n=1 Tax=Streptomyces sp. A3M-1-3 TaxID=2962044 RepID=UPI0020B67A1E|nr:SH3 domain-containing protein [Streptomyces sp. A3M-1-3]MCP3822349.1 SH3 domain-containing protein [Streptomyces sp. A3M-1-3]